MMREYRDRNTERLAAGEKVASGSRSGARPRSDLRILDAALSLGELAALNSTVWKP